jgi:hypothetical protein
VWLGRTAISPIASRAIVTAPSLGRAKKRVSGFDTTALAAELVRLRALQPELGGWIARKLGAARDDAARAMGAGLAALVWLAFEDALQGEIGTIDARELENARELLSLDEALRKTDPSEALESEDVIVSLQPHLGAWVSGVVSETLRGEGEVDVDEVDSLYRMVLVEVLALSYAVGTAGEVQGS